MPEETWKCPSCKQEFPVSERVCPVCKVTQMRYRDTGEEAAEFSAESAEILLPHILPEVRFNIPLEAGAAWSSGILFVTEAAFYLLSAKDALDLAALTASPPKVPGLCGPLSFAIPKSMIKRVVHDRMIGQFIEIEGKKIPIRLDAAGWKTLDAVCDRLGIAHS